MTDRYTKAIDQLGPDKGLDVRIGGIYALERIARDSPRDHPTIMEVLGAFIREHSGEHGRRVIPVLRHQSIKRARTYKQLSPSSDAELSDMTTIAIRSTSPVRTSPVRTWPVRTSPVRTWPVQRVAANLTGADLAGAKLLAANLARADLSEADLTGAFLALANLKSAELAEANLTRANLSGADLTGALSGLANFTCADLSDADLTNAKLSVVRLVDARLSGANLAGAFLVNADLTGAFLVLANFTDAELTAVHLAGANLTDALWPGDAEIPEGWRRDTDSGRLKARQRLGRYDGRLNHAPSGRMSSRSHRQTASWKPSPEPFWASACAPVTARRTDRCPPSKFPARHVIRVGIPRLAISAPFVFPVRRNGATVTEIMRPASPILIGQNPVGHPVMPSVLLVLTGPAGPPAEPGNGPGQQANSA